MKSQQIEHLNHILKSFAKHTAHTHFGKLCSKHHKDGKTIPQVLRKKQLRSEKNCRSCFIEPLSNPKCWINWGRWAGMDTSHSIWSEPRPRSCHPLQQRQLLSQTKPPGGTRPMSVISFQLGHFQSASGVRHRSSHEQTKLQTQNCLCCLQNLRQKSLNLGRL